jgi:hypothetical protein
MMNLRFQYIAIQILFLVLTLPSLSQTNYKRFNAGVIAGLNFAELEGKGRTDYYGINAGLKGCFRFSKHTQLGLEMLYSRNGEYILPAYYPPLEYGKINLSHLEVPLYIEWLIGVFERENFYDWRIQLGGAYASLFHYKVFDKDDRNVTDEIIYKDKTAVLLQAGTSYFITKNIGIHFRSSLPVQADGLSWTMAFRMEYMF